MKRMLELKVESVINVENVLDHNIPLREDKKKDK